MCRKLGIEIIGANSPQAKGRVERSHGTHQDRLIKKMRLKRIATYEQANAFLKETYLPAHNARYAVAPVGAVDFHETVPQHLNLEDVFCLEQQRTLSQDWVMQYGARWLQIEPEPYVPAASKVTGRQHGDGSLSWSAANGFCAGMTSMRRPKPCRNKNQKTPGAQSPGFRPFPGGSDS